MADVPLLRAVSHSHHSQNGELLDFTLQLPTGPQLDLKPSRPTSRQQCRSSFSAKSRHERPIERRAESTPAVPHLPMSS